MVFETPEYMEEEVTAEEFAQNFKGVTYEDLGIMAGSTKTMWIDNYFEFGTAIYVVDENTIWIVEEGVLFKAERIAPAD